MKIKFLGAAGMVTGSCYLVKGNKGNLMIDFGMFQGEYEELNAKWPEFEVTNLKVVVLTHAHLDHCGRLPMLVQMGYKGEIFMTKATKDLVEISLLDSARINEKEGEQGLYTTDDVLKLFKLFRVKDFGESFVVGEFEVEFKRAGHILGAASVIVREGDKQVVFSGDVGTGKSPLIKPWIAPEVGGTVVMESTYGNRLHGKNEELRIIKEQVDYVYRTGGVLMVPVFSIQRAQRVLYRFHQLYGKEGLPGGMKVYFDSPMAIAVTRVFKKRLKSVGKDPFSFPGLVVTEKGWESRKKIGKDGGSKVIIAGSGMMSGGRIVRHAVNYLGDEKNRLLIVGYQAEGTLGRELVDLKIGSTHVARIPHLKRSPTVTFPMRNTNSSDEKPYVVEIDGKEVKVKAGIERIKSMSAHADQKQLLEWLGKIRGVKKVILTHGEDEAREELAIKIKERLGLEVLEPSLGEEIEV